MKKKALIVSYFLPYPLISGGHQAVFNSIDVMRQDFDIHLLFNEDKQSKINQKTLEELWPEVKFHPYTLPKRNFKNVGDFLIRFAKKVHHLLMSRTKLWGEFSSCAANHSSDYLDYISSVITKNDIDIVQTEFIPGLSLVAALPRSVKTVFIHHELRFTRHELIMKEQNLTDSFHKYKYNCLKSEELGFLSLYDAIVTLSEVDVQKLKKEGIPEQKLYSSLAIVKQKKEIKSPSHFNGSLTFVGPEHHRLNVIGLEWFLDNCWNTILKNDNKLQLKIIGQWSAKTRKQWCSKYKNIVFLGFVENLYEALSDSVMVVPITVGSGIRMKIQEAAMMKIPFVTTTVGVEGLPFNDAEDCFICDDATDFANKVLMLKDDLALQQQFTASANDKIKTLFSPDKLRESRSIVYNNLGM